MKIRVVHIIAKLELGGAQRVVLETIRRLDRKQFESVLITGKEGILVDEAKRIGQELNIKTYFLPQLLREIRPIQDLRALYAIKQILRASSIQHPASRIIVHTHGSKAGVLGRFAAKMARVPVIIHTIHGFSFHDFQNLWIKKLYIGLERFCGKFTTVLVAVSRATQKKGLRVRIGGPFQYRVIPPGTRIEEFLHVKVDPNEKKKELGIPVDVKVVGTITCFKPQKAPLDFIQVAKGVIGTLPDCRFLIVGDGELRGEVEKMIQEFGLADHVKLLGWRRDVPEVLSTFDLFLLTSLWEGLPLVYGEVMSEGKPIVATRVDGTPEVIEDGVNGYLVEPRDIKGMVDRVLRLLKDDGLRKKMGEAGRKRAGQFDVQNGGEN
ncbi:glycosyltransferase family 4 protein [candidate division TA06 bacterium]|nr:glycosyltransferase family 4 protein [candidate division TA06 bacterium]